MGNKKLRILILSSCNPYAFANLGLDIMHMMERNGDVVGFLTLYDFKGQTKNMYSLFHYSLKQKIVTCLLNIKLLKWIYLLLKKKGQSRKMPYIFRNNQVLINYDETQAPVNPQLLISRIKDCYDLIITVIWQDMITVATLKALYARKPIPILIIPADMFPMTGGCQYPRQCLRFEQECGCCPILDSNNNCDQTHLNYLFKKEVYSHISCALLSNSYMLEMAHRSNLFNSVKLTRLIYVIDETIYYPRDIEACRIFFKLDKEKKFIMLARSVNQADYSRKGIHLLVKSINQFCSDKSDIELRKILLLLIGEVNETIQSQIPIDVVNLGVLNTENLIKCYSAASVFLSPSVDDAGPSMVNQAIMCGTPTVAFHVGTAIDVIVSRKNGYKAEWADANDFAKGIEYIYNLDKTDYIKMRKTTREMALQFQSMKTNAEIVERTYAELLQENKKGNLGR